MDVQQVKQRFGIIGFSPLLERAIDIAIQVAPTDLSVLITGESGTGKEVMPQIIHQLSARKHGKYIAVNCGAIPEGTIDSELFGHEKGAFTGAHESRKGYFEVVDGGTIFLDEVGELPLQTQSRLLRVLETGEFIKVGSSKVQKTNVRIIAATNVNLPQAVQKHKFREDLYYRLNTVPIIIPALRERKEDIHLLFRKFASDFATKYRMPPLKLTDEAVKLLENYRWPGNIRQLKNITEQISVIEKNRTIDYDTLKKYIPFEEAQSLPAVIEQQNSNFTERELLYKVLFDLKNDVTELKKLVFNLVKSGSLKNIEDQPQIIKSINKLYNNDHEEDKYILPLPEEHEIETREPEVYKPEIISHPVKKESFNEPKEEVEESLSIADKEKELILKALNKHNGKRKYAAQDLGISERTLYRKIKEYNIN
ncbi:MAG: sigma-54-dependent Fis family transcriptional regulator [Vicingaceae bacterium]